MTSERNWIASLRSQWRARETRLLHCVRNDEREKLDCFTAFAMTGSWSLWGECNESNLFEWQELYTLLPSFPSHEKAPYHSDCCTSCLATFSRSGVSFWRGGKMSGKVRFFIIFRLAWACRKYHRNDRSDAQSWLSQELRKLPWKQSYD